MAYCTAANVKVYAGAVVSDADLTAMIADADDEIDQFFLTRGGLTPGSDVTKKASILLVRAEIADRFNLTGENPTSYAYPDYSQSGVSDHAQSAREYRDRAYGLMRDELNRVDTPYMLEEDIVRSDAVMPDFKLDQSDISTYYAETDDDPEES
ncbi:MAG: hypothetical protein PHH09_08170 [Methanoregulaceae archaeon]|nr:hypothetical protein [Methanoregulaceae archaeon]